MFDLTTANGTLQYLASTKFAASDVQLLSGGHSAFTYRAMLKDPLPTGERTIILKHFEGYVALYNVAKLEVQRARFEYKALGALADSGLIDSSSIVQAPRPVHYDSETHTIFMTDLGSPKRLSQFLEDELNCARPQDSNPNLESKDTYSLISQVGSALGDFLGRYHNWTSRPEQSELRTYFSQNIAATEQGFAFHRDTMIRSADMFDVKEAWMVDVLAREMGPVGDDTVIAMGDCWLDNILVSAPSMTGGLRLYIVDWELTRLAPAEFDVGEVTGAAISFARRYHPQSDFPFVSTLHQAYRKHRTLDPLRIATMTGVDLMGFGTVLPWARDQSEDYLKEVALMGLQLLKLAQEQDRKSITERSSVKHLFLPHQQQLI